jgi:5-(carboxyamino)imidazole ribonucleotide synthase
MTRIGLLGGGQLAQMLTQAAISLGIDTAVYERTPDSPAARLTTISAVGEWDDLPALEAFAARCDLLTLENEFIYADSLAHLERRGVTVLPSSATLATIQDKLLQKQCYSESGLAVPRFAAVDSPADVARTAESFGYPLVLKTRYGGYDGYGNAAVDSVEDIPAAWEHLMRSGRRLMIEAWVPFERELAVMILRGLDGEIRAYPVVETIQQNHICHVVRAPAEIAPEIAARAVALASQAVTALDGVGVFGVELFLLPDGSLLLNEAAPRPHNSGHYTIEACVTSQFENHLRAVLGMPLGDTRMIAPAAVMVNVLGRRSGPVDFDGIRDALAVEGAHLHLYGKHESRIGRKMGHVTALGATLAAAEAVARNAESRITL